MMTWQGSGVAGVMLAGNGWQAGNLHVQPGHTPNTAGALALGARWKVGALNLCLRPVAASPPLTARAFAWAYPGYTFWWDGRGDAEPALVARRKTGTGPHTVVTRDTAEMHAILSAARRP